MVAIRAMQARVARLDRKRESIIEKACGSWEAFHDMMMETVNKGEIEPGDAETIYFSMKALHDDPALCR